MRAHTCPHCDLLVFFDDTRCLGCGNQLAFRPSTRTVVGVGADDLTCSNRPEIRCSWLVEDVPSQSDRSLCRSCRLTETRPPDDDPDLVAAWADAERAKRMLLAQCDEMGIDISGVRFELKSSTVEPVVTGHADGVITIDVRESDDVTRTQMRERMGEAYRTMLGHFRHEIGHYLWMELVDGTPAIADFRAVFGDDRADYAAALEHHYANPAPADWQDHHVSEYASAHPWEDFAETVAHYLHIRDTLQTAASFGISVHGAHDALDAEPAKAEPIADPGSGGSPAPAAPSEIETIIAEWLPLTYALNAVNRSMGAKALYPFVLAPEVITKLGWVHALLAPTP